jgi:hypothetical protein
MSFLERHQMRGISGKSSAYAAGQLKFGGWGGRGGAQLDLAHGSPRSVVRVIGCRSAYGAGGGDSSPKWEVR